MESGRLFTTNQKINVPEILEFTKYLLKKPNIYHRRLSVYANIVPNPELIHINIALTKRQQHFVRDCPLTFLNGSKIEAQITCSKYAHNFGILGDISVFPPRCGDMEHNFQLEMSTNGPLVRYTFVLAKDLKNDLVNNLTAQFIASGSCGLVPSTTINQQFAIGAHLWAPFPFVESLRSHGFLNIGASPNHPSYTAGIGISTPFSERGRIDLNYCVRTGIQFGIGFDYSN